LNKVFVTLLGLFCAIRSQSAPPAVIGNPDSYSVPGNCAPFAYTRYTPVHQHEGCQVNGKRNSMRTSRMYLRGIDNLCSNEGYDQGRLTNIYVLTPFRVACN